MTSPSAFETSVVELRATLRDLEPSAALTLARRLLEENAKDPLGHLALGLAARRLGRPDAAIGGALTAGRLAPNSAEVARCLGEVLLEADRVEDAAVALRHAVGLAPTDHDARVLLASALATVGGFQQAVAELDRVLAVAPDHPRARATRDLIAQALGAPATVR
jgi:protein O-GlcNAc transferase